MRHTKTIATITAFACVAIFFSRCFNDSRADPRGTQYAGTQACMNCHKDIYNSYFHNNHYKTSAAVNNDSIGKMVPKNHRPFHFSDSTYVDIVNHDGSFFQSYRANGKEIRSGRFDIAFGSGEKAYTYGYWKEDTLYQLPLTYFDSMKTWAISPGFPVNRAWFGRVIDSRCFECHASYVDKEMVQSGSLSVAEKLDRNSIVYGIDCERCHGPALSHVKFQQDNPSEKTAKYITSIKSLNRQQQLDMCGVCHSGNDKPKQRSLFAFVPGDTLSNFYYPDFDYSRKEPDVHGKQMQLLEMSKCFINSQMTCNTCHGSHTKEGNDIASFISKCMSCHQTSDHAQKNFNEYEQTKSGPTVSFPTCIDCHMPLQSSKAISFGTGMTQKSIPYFLRTHKIGVYK